MLRWAILSVSEDLVRGMTRALCRLELLNVTILMSSYIS